MPTDIRAYHDRTLPSAPLLRMDNPSQHHAISNRRTQNNQVPSRSHAAQPPGISNSSESPRVQVPTSNNLNIQNHTTNDAVYTEIVETNSQEESPPPYQAALDMIVTPRHNQNSE